MHIYAANCHLRCFCGNIFLRSYLVFEQISAVMSQNEVEWSTERNILWMQLLNNNVCNAPTRAGII